MGAKKRKNMGKTITVKLVVIREVDKNERTKSEMAQTYGIPLSTLTTYLKKRKEFYWTSGFARPQYFEAHEDLLCKTWQMEDNLFEQLCRALKNRLPVEG